MKTDFIKPGAWGLALGIAVTLLIGLQTGWLLTARKADSQANAAVEKAVVADLTPICVAQFQKDPNRAADLADLKAKESWNRGDFVEAKGWSVMPGGKAADGEVASACAQQIAQLEK